MNELLVESVRIDWSVIDGESYLRKIEALKGLCELEFKKPVTFFVGENGSGKSTLLEAIAVSYGFNPEGGSPSYCFSTCDSHSELCNAVKIVRGVHRAKWGYFLRAESLYNVATKEMDYVDWNHDSKEYHKKSHGELFLTLVQEHFGARGMYILDEPEAALSPERQLALLCEISECAGQGSQFIIATHSPILLGLPGAQILSFDGGLKPCKYEDTQSFRITASFVNNREKFIKELGIDQ